MDLDDDERDGIIVHPDDPVPWFPEPEQDDKPARLKRRKRCGQCGPCQVKSNCGQCSYCLRRSVLKQSCIYRKCIYLRKPVSNRSPNKSDRIYKRQMLMTGIYPSELLSPEAELDSSYELQSPPENNGYTMGFTPSDQMEVMFPEFSQPQSIIIEPVANTDNNPDEEFSSRPGTPDQNSPCREVSKVTYCEDELLSLYKPSSCIQPVSTPPHPMEENEDQIECVYPQMVKALETVEKCGHKFIQKPTSPTPETLISTNNVEISECVTPQLTKSLHALSVANTDTVSNDTNIRKSPVSRQPITSQDSSSSPSTPVPVSLELVTRQHVSFHPSTNGHETIIDHSGEIPGLFEPVTGHHLSHQAFTNIRKPIARSLYLSSKENPFVPFRQQDKADSRIASSFLESTYQQSPGVRVPVDGTRTPVSMEPVSMEPVSSQELQYQPHAGIRGPVDDSTRTPVSMEPVSMEPVSSQELQYQPHAGIRVPVIRTPVPFNPVTNQKQPYHQSHPNRQTPVSFDSIMSQYQPPHEPADFIQYPSVSVDTRRTSLFSGDDTPAGGTSSCHSNQSVSSTFSNKHRQFFSPPNVTVGRLGGFTSTHSDPPPLNLSRPPVPSDISRHLANIKALAKNSVSLSPQPWPVGMPPYNFNYPPHTLPRMSFPPGVYPPAYSMGQFDYPSGYPPYMSLPGHPCLPARMEGYGQYQPNSLFPPDKYPVPPGLFPGGYYPPSFRHPNEHMIYRTTHPQLSGLEDFSKHPDFRRRLESSQQFARQKELEKQVEIGAAEMEEYKKYSIFRLPVKPNDEAKPADLSKPADSKECEQTKEVLKIETVPPVRNETLRKLLNCNNTNNLATGGKTAENEIPKSAIDEDLRNEMNKMSCYCSCNFITIDDLKMQALIRSDGVNNLEIEIPSPNMDMNDSIKVCSDKSCENSQKESPIFKESIKPLPRLITVTGSVCLKQDLGDEGVLMLEVQSERVLLVQCILDEEILKQSNNPKELKDYIIKSQLVNLSDQSVNFSEDKIRVDNPQMSLNSSSNFNFVDSSKESNKERADIHSPPFTRADSAYPCSIAQSKNWKQNYVNLFSNTLKTIVNQPLPLETSRPKESLKLPTIDSQLSLYTTSESAARWVMRNSVKRPAPVKRWSGGRKRLRIDNSNKHTLNSKSISPYKSITIMNRLSQFVDTTIKSYTSDSSESTDINEPMSDSAIMSCDYFSEPPRSDKTLFNGGEDMSDNELTELKPDNFKIISNTDSFYCESESKSETETHDEVERNNEFLICSSVKDVSDNFEIVSNTESVSCEPVDMETDPVNDFSADQDVSLESRVENTSEELGQAFSKCNIESAESIRGDNSLNNNITMSAIQSILIEPRENQDAFDMCEKSILLSSDYSNPVYNCIDNMSCSSSNGICESVTLTAENSLSFAISSVCSVSQDIFKATSSLNPTFKTSTIRNLLNKEVLSTSANNINSETGCFSLDNIHPCDQSVINPC